MWVEKEEEADEFLFWVGGKAVKGCYFLRRPGCVCLKRKMGEGEWLRLMIDLFLLITDLFLSECLFHTL